MRNMRRNYENKGLKILLSVLLVLCIIMAGALIGKEYIEII